MTKQLKWIELKSIPVDYIKKELGNSKSLSQYLLKTFDKVKIKKVFSLVPPNTIPERMLELDLGGLCETSDSNGELIRYIINSIKNEYSMIFENNIKNKSDPYLTSLKIPYFTKGEEIYFFYSNTKHNIEVLRKILLEADRYPFIAFMSKINCQNFEEIDEQMLNEIVVSSEEILMGAYDEESYIRIEIK